MNSSREPRTTLVGWNNDYELTQQYVDKAREIVRASIANDSGEDSISNVVANLRHALRVPSLRCDQETLIESLGFTLRYVTNDRGCVVRTFVRAS